MYRLYFEQASSDNTRQKYSVRLCLDSFDYVPDQGYRPNNLLKVLSSLCFYAFFASIPKKGHLVYKLWNIYGTLYELEHLLIFLWRNLLRNNLYYYKKKKKVILNTVNYLCWWLSLQKHSVLQRPFFPLQK